MKKNIDKYIIPAYFTRFKTIQARHTIPFSACGAAVWDFLGFHRHSGNQPHYNNEEDLLKVKEK